VPVGSNGTRLPTRVQGLSCRVAWPLESSRGVDETLVSRPWTPLVHARAGCSPLPGSDARVGRRTSMPWAGAPCRWHSRPRVVSDLRHRRMCTTSRRRDPPRRVSLRRGIVGAR